MKGVDDSALVAAAVAGDGSAYGELFALYEKRIYNYAYGILGNQEDAADVAQDAFVRVFQALSGKDASLNFSAYLYRTAHNIAMDAIKQRSRFAGPTALELEREPALQAQPEKVALLVEQQEQTWRAVAGLAENHRSILALRELHDMSYQEIADVMEMPRSTVGVLLSRARIKFREAFRMSSVDVESLAEECQRMLPLLCAYIDDELEEAEHHDVDSHLEECAFCQLALEDMAEASASYRAILPLLPPARLGEGFRTEVLEMLDPEEAYALERTLDEAAGSSGASPRSKASAGRWVARAVLVLAGAAVIALVGASTVGELTLMDSDEMQAPTQADEPASRSGSAESLTPNEPSPLPVDEDAEEDESDESQESGEPEDAAATAGSDGTPPPTPSQLSPANGGYHDADSTVVLAWETVDDPSGVVYGVELQRYDTQVSGYVGWKTIDGLSSPSLTYRTGDTNERWRVWAVDGEGNWSGRSGWWTISKAVVVQPMPDAEEPPMLY